MRAHDEERRRKAAYRFAAIILSHGIPDIRADEASPELIAELHRIREALDAAGAVPTLELARPSKKKWATPAIKTWPAPEPMNQLGDE